MTDLRIPLIESFQRVCQRYGLVCATASCPGAQLAARVPHAEKFAKASTASLIALFLPGTLFATGLFLLRHDPRFVWLHDLAKYPWQFWVIALAGTVATLAGFGDWALHRWAAKCVIGKKERNCELLALGGGGVSMFVLMSAASVCRQPAQLLLPILVVLLFTVTLICYDEFVFHRRRCQKLETMLHRLLVFGNGTAWLAWAHWCFARGGIYV
jgi:hypothetical protein